MPTVLASGYYYRVQATAQQATTDPFIHEQQGPAKKQRIAAEKLKRARATINQPDPVAINVPKPAAQKPAVK